MLEDGDNIDVSQYCGSSWDVDVSQSGAWTIRTRTFVNIPVKTPFTINLAQIEYCKGAINPETNNYELKVRFCSGNELWLAGEAATGLLEQIDYVSHKRDESAELAEKFKAKIKCAELAERLKARQ